MKLFTIILGAGETQQLDVVGFYYRIITASAAVSIGTNNGDMQALAQGIGEETAEQFSRLYIASDSAQTIVLAVANRRVDDSRLSITAPVSVSDISAPVDISVGATIVNAMTSVGTVALQLLAANSARRSVFIFNNSATATLYVGNDATVSSANGWPIQPKSGLVIEKAATAAVWAISSGAATDVRTLTEAD